MKCPTVSKAWEAYENKCLKTSSAVTRKAMRKIFFVGAYAAITAESEAASSTESAAEAATLFDHIVNDVRINLGMEPLKGGQ